MNISSFNEVYDDMVYSLHKYGFSFEDYIVLELYNKTDNDRAEYISDKLRFFYCDILNAPGLYDLMKDKWECYKAYKKFYKREVIPCLSASDYEQYKDFFSRHNKFIYKPLKEHSGHGIEIIEKRKIVPEQWYKEQSEKNPGVIEELIKQVGELNKFNPLSVNTCRVITFYDGIEVKIMRVFLRMSKGHNVVDNTGAGGIIALVDNETGIVRREGYDLKCNQYVLHPTSGTVIPGFRLPEWDKAKELINEMVRHLSGATLIGWDIGYSDKGWLMIEGNENSMWQAEQIAVGRGLKGELFDLMDEYFEKRLNNI